MNIIDQLSEDLKSAMRAKETDRLNVIKNLRAALKNVAIDKGEELSEEEAVGVVKREQKKLVDALEQFRSGGRADLVSKTEGEIAVMGRYLPAMLGEGEVRALVQSTIAAAGVVTPQDFGRIMKEVMTAAKNRADGSTVSRLVKEALAG
jgi:uncharacterized protein YqeY